MARESYGLRGHQLKIHAFAAAAILGTALTGCASVIDGTSQEITVNSNPSDATCVFYRQGIAIGSVHTPGILNVKRRKYDIEIKCDKPGFTQATYLNHSGVSAMIAGNIAADIVLTAGISSIVDSASGADNRYDPVVNITLAPASVTSTRVSSSSNIETASTGN
jgi:hypothetical protein